LPTFPCAALPLLRAVRTCNACFLKNVAWDSSRTYDVLGPADGKPVVLVHGALIGRQCLVLEARALADAGFRCVSVLYNISLLQTSNKSSYLAVLCGGG
jgi:hypothetical protein